MGNKDGIRRVEGQVIEALPGTTFKVNIGGGQEVLAHLAGKMRLHHIKILPGDRVLVEITPYDDYRGRIIRRL